MEPVADYPPLIVILGQTASGKSALAMDVAKRFNAEIIAADSRTVYKGMDIGTAKPSVEDQKSVHHHLIDIIEPDEPYTVADFQRMACSAIQDIASRGKLPLMVGGTGLYADSVIYNFSFRRPASDTERRKLHELSLAELQQLLQERGINLPENKNNQRHLVRVLETGGEIPKREELRPRTLVIGILKEKSDLEGAIRDRIDAMIDAGFIDEVRELAKRYGWAAPGLQAPGYKTFRMYFAGQVTMEEAKQQFVQQHLQYAKRQKTWFRRNSDIRWISKSEEAVDLITAFLNK